MAARAFTLNGSEMATKDTQEIINAIVGLKESFSVSLNAVSVNVAGLDVKVQTMGIQISALTQEVKDKASRNELIGLKEAIEKELSRVESGVSKDAEGFQQMYESVVGEVREMRDALKEIKERLNKIEPLKDQATEAKGFVAGAGWVVHILWAIGGGAIVALIIKAVSK